MSSGDNSRTDKRTPRRGRARTKRGTYAPELPTERHRAAIADIAAGVPISKALPAHGFSESFARQGMTAIRSSSGLRMAWTEAAEAKLAQPLPSVDVRKHTWWHDAMDDLHKGSNRRVPILRVVGQALGTLAPENQTLVQVNVAAPSQAASQWEDSDTDCQSPTKP